MEALREGLSIEEVELIKGHGGVFEVSVDGVIVAKKTMGQFPDEATIVKAVQAALQGQ